MGIVALVVVILIVALAMALASMADDMENKEDEGW